MAQPPSSAAVWMYSFEVPSNIYDVALSMAEKRGSRYYLLPARLLVASKEERSRWCENRLFRTVASIASRANLRRYWSGRSQLPIAARRLHVATRSKKFGQGRRSR